MDRKTMAVVAALVVAASAFARPAPGPALAKRLAEGPEIIGLVHWGPNTYQDREWGYGDADPAIVAPAKFDARQIVRAAKSAGIGGIVVVAKHHDGFCLWPTKTTDYNISASPFRGGKGDYVKEISDACRAEGLKFGVYVSPWDRHDADYARPSYVEKYHAQLKELLGGAYGEIFEVWFDGANGGDGWYGGAKERRKFSDANEYYRFGEILPMVRSLQPDATIFYGENDASDFRWPGNERGILHPDSRATIETVGGYAGGTYGNPAYRGQMNTGSPDGKFFRACEADFPLRNGWIWHPKSRGDAPKSAAYLVKLYLSSVGNGGTMNIGIAPDRDGLVCEEDVRALAGFGALRKALFSREVKPGEGPFNVVEMSEDLSGGEQVDEWEFVAGGKTILRGKSIGRKRIRLLDKPCGAKTCELRVLKSGGSPKNVAFKLYLADEELAKLVRESSTKSGETDTARWMTGQAQSVE